MKPHSVGGPYETLYLRDSGTYSVGVEGNIFLSLVDSANSFHNRTYSGGMISGDSLVVADYKRGTTTTKAVPAGTFSTISMEFVWTFYPYAAQNAPISSRRNGARFAKGIGMVSEVMPFYAADPMYVERRLVRYHVQ
jgi:hypothetical protein